MKTKKIDWLQKNARFDGMNGYSQEIMHNTVYIPKPDLVV